MSNDNNSNNSNSTNEPKRLSHETVYELCGVFARLEQLRNAPADVQILRPDTSRTPDSQQLTRDAEIEVLVEHLAGVFLAHASEFLGAWLALQTEFSPLVRALAPIVKRCVAMPDSAAPLMPETMRPNTDVKGGDNVQ